MDIRLRKMEVEEADWFLRKMKSSFEQGVLDRFGDVSAAPVPPEKEVKTSFADGCCDVFILLADGTPAGGTIIKREEKGKYSLDLLFIFKAWQNQKIGFAAWQAIEAHYPDAALWETCTPYFDRRNIHFYLNKCGFCITEFFNTFHRDEKDLTDQFRDAGMSGFFRFEKRMPSQKVPQ